MGRLLTILQPPSGGGGTPSDDIEINGETLSVDGATYTFDTTGYDRGKLLAPLIVAAGTDNVTIQGSTSDADDTIIYADFAAADGPAMIDVRGQYPGGSSLTTIAVAVEPQHTTITVTDGSSLPSGEAYYCIRQYNDTAFFANELDLPDGTGYNTSGNRGSGNTPYIRNVFVKQTSRSGNVITLEEPVGMRFGTGATTEIKRITTPCIGITIQNLTLDYYPGPSERGDPDPLDYTNAFPDYLVSLIKATGAVGLVVKNVKLLRAGQQAILLDGCYKPVIGEDDGQFKIRCEGAWNKGEGGNGYFEISRTYWGEFYGIYARGMRHVTFQWSSYGNFMKGLDCDCDLNWHGGGSGGMIGGGNVGGLSVGLGNVVWNANIVLRVGHTPGYGVVSRTPDSATFAPPDFMGANRVYSDAGTTEIYPENWRAFASIDVEAGSIQYFSMTNVNWGSYNRSLNAGVITILRESVGASMRLLFKGTALSNAEFTLQFTSTDKLEFRTFSAANVADGIFQSTESLNSTSDEYTIYWELDVADVTPANRLKLWANGVPLTPSGSSVNPASAIYTSTGNVGLFAEADGGVPFDGTGFQFAFFSGSKPGVANVYDTVAGEPKDLTRLAGKHAMLYTNMIDPITRDFVKGDVWVNNNAATAVLQRPYA